MKTKLIPSVVASALLTCAGFASASDAITLTEKQMDNVAAGAHVFIRSAGSTAEAFTKDGLAVAGTRNNVVVGKNYIRVSTSGAALAAGPHAWAKATSGPIVIRY